MSVFADVPDSVLVRVERDGGNAWHRGVPVVVDGWVLEIGVIRNEVTLWPPGSWNAAHRREASLDGVRRELGRRLFGGWGAAQEDGR